MVCNDSRFIHLPSTNRLMVPWLPKRLATCAFHHTHSQTLLQAVTQTPYLSVSHKHTVFSPLLEKTHVDTKSLSSYPPISNGLPPVSFHRYSHLFSFLWISTLPATLNCNILHSILAQRFSIEGTTLISPGSHHPSQSIASCLRDPLWNPYTYESIVTI